MKAMHFPIKKLDMDELENVSGGSKLIGPEVLYSDTLIQSTAFPTEQARTMGKAYEEAFDKIKDFFAGFKKLPISKEAVTIPVTSHISGFYF